MNIYQFIVRDAQGAEVPLSIYQNKVLLIVNTASRCGFTPQYSGLQQLHSQFENRSFSVLAFPCNQFGNQEPGTDEEIQSFCTVQYKINFPVFAKVLVNGTNAEPLFTYLAAKAPGVLGSRAIKWNFTKFLVDRSGAVVCRFAPTQTPEKLQQDIESLL